MANKSRNKNLKCLKEILPFRRVVSLTITLIIASSACKSKQDNFNESVETKKKAYTTLADTVSYLTENPWKLNEEEYTGSRTLELKADSCVKKIIELVDKERKFFYLVEIDDPAQADVGTLRGMQRIRL